MHYLDNAATTVVYPEVANRIAEVLERHFANPASLYAPGFEAEQVIDDARVVLKDALGASTVNEVYFTGSGTEGNNIALLGAALARRGWGIHIVTTGYEHPSAQRPLELLQREFGFKLTVVNPGADGGVDTKALIDAVGPGTVLVNAMHVNNENGAVLDVAALAAAVKAKNNRTAVHVDGVQAFLKQPLRLSATKIDSYAVSGHKLHGPKGVGALYLRRGHTILPLYTGGGQERGIRPGTENTAYIAGFAKAVKLALAGAKQGAAKVLALQNRLEGGLLEIEGLRVNTPKAALPGIYNISLPNVRSETMLHFLEARGIYVSSGSACSKGEPSHTLTAMGLNSAEIEGGLRISFDGNNTEEDIDALLSGLKDGLATLARRRVGT